MKILFLSDLHLDINAQYLKFSMFPFLCEHFSKNTPDIVIISGDTANFSELVVEYFNRLQTLFPTINFYFISGNHDIASDDDSFKEIDILKTNKSYLHNQAVHINDNTVLIGWSGWYNYSFKHDYHFLKQVLSAKKKYWFDANHVFLNSDDLTHYNQQYNELKRLLDENKDKNVILSTHFIPYKEFITFNKSDKHWDICNAFMGAESTGILIDQYPNVKYVAFGHTHKRYGLVNFKDKQLICNPLGYKFEWKNNEPQTKEDILNELELASIFINL